MATDGARAFHATWPQSHRVLDQPFLAGQFPDILAQNSGTACPFPAAGERVLFFLEM